jgi:miniconductance mechanosensitive channel
MLTLAKTYSIQFFSTFPGLEQYAKPISEPILFLGILLTGLLFKYITAKILIQWIHYYFARSKNQYDDVIVEKRIFHKAANYIPAIILLYSAPFIFTNDSVLSFSVSCVKIYLIIISTISALAILDVLLDIYKKLPVSEHVHIVGYIQVIKIVVYILAFMLVLSIVLNQSPYAILTSLGAVTAILLLIFKDTIMGFVANVQLTANKMIHTGDWITVGTLADGEVIDITLTTVKVQNWDKSISMVPTAALVTGSFVNWSGIYETKGRRAKRQLLLDINSITVADETMLHSLKKFAIIADEIQEFDDNIRKATAAPSNSQLFRIYLNKYLLEHPKVINNLGVSVRYQPSDGRGLPLEYLVFCTELGGGNIEAFQSEIIEHVLDVMPLFKLKLFQLQQ